MQNLQSKDSIQTEKMFTQEEVNNKISKRLAREKRQLHRELEQELLKIEVIGKLEQQNIPLEFASFIIVSKNSVRTYQILERFITVWHKCVSRN